MLTLGGLVFGLCGLLIGETSVLGASRENAWEALGLAVLLTLPAYAFRLLGAGDVKLAAAIAALTGLNIFICVYVVATLLVLSALVLFHYINYIPYANLLCPGTIPGTASPKARGGRSIPFGAALGSALVFVMLGRLAGFHV
jgi:prepilin peptidase CpaA